MQVILIVASLGLLGISFYLDYISGNAGTKDWLLLAARKWLGGQTLYVDIFEVNPPLIIWIYALPVWVSMHSALIDFHALVLLGVALAMISIGLCALLMRLHPQVGRDGQKLLWWCILLALVLVAFVNPVYFADREHIFLLLALPYMLRNMPALRFIPLPLPLRMVLGVLGGVGFCVKPYCVIVFTGIQLLIIGRDRKLDAILTVENAAICTVAALYLALVFYITPEYVHTVLPMALATYSAYRPQANIFVLFGIFFTFAMTFVEFRPRYASPYRSDIWYLLGVCVLCLAYALANNGWTYTYLPLQSLLLITAGFVFCEFRFLAQHGKAASGATRSLRFGALACAFNFAANSAMVLLMAYAALGTGYHNDAMSREMGFEGIIRSTKAHSFGTLTLDFLPWAHLVRSTGAAWRTRFNHLWMLPKFMRSDEAFARRNAWVLQTVARGLAQDMDGRKPDVVFVNTRPQICSTCKPADIPAFFLPFPAFRSAWDHYYFFRRLDVCPPSREKPRTESSKEQSPNSVCQYDVYVRRRKTIGWP